MKDKAKRAHMVALFDLLYSEGFIWRQRHSESLAVMVAGGPAHYWTAPHR